MELVLQPPEVGTDPLVALLITLGAVWVFGAPWVRLCWWLGARAHQTRAVAPMPFVPSICSAPQRPAVSSAQRTVRFAVLLLALGGGLREMRSQV